MAVELSSHQFHICQAVNGQFCTHHPYTFPAASKPNNLHFSLYARNLASISSRCSVQIRKTSDIGISSQIAPNIWILTRALSTPGKATMLIKVEKPIHILRIPTAYSATLSNFHLPPRYQNWHLEVNISLDMANLNMVNISSLDFCIWQHSEDHRNKTQLQHLATIASIPVNKVYQHIISGTQHITPFNTADESTGIYVTAIGLVIPVGLGIF